MRKYSVVYIDDDPEAALSSYLGKEYSSPGVEIKCIDIRFDPSKGYESLLENDFVRQANIIFVDSKLFENNNAGTGKFTGEEFKFVMKKFFPYIEVIVITQNEVDEGISVIQKYDSRKFKSAKEYYDLVIPSELEKAFRNIDEYRKLSERINGNNSWEKVLREKVIATLEGSGEYDSLTKSDIDSLIQAFKEVKEKLNGC